MSGLANPSVTSVLHIRCGDDILGKLKEAGLPGGMIRWADALCQGPTPGGLSPDEWRRVRAQHAADHYGVQHKEGVAFLTSQDQDLERFRAHDEVLLWFEHDLFDQIVLIYLLDWFSRQDLGHTRLSLICPDRHIGNMNTQQLAQLWGTQHKVAAAELALASRAWKAFCAPDPSGIEEVIRSDTAALPHLELAFKRHLQEFPSVKNGLGRTEQTALEIIAAGVSEPVRLFHEVQEREERFWLGDSMFWPYLEEFAAENHPPLRIEGSGPWPSRGHLASTRRVFITPTAQAVLAGQQDRIALNGIDRWFGGVHLQGKQIPWRWDDQQQALVQSC